MKFKLKDALDNYTAEELVRIMEEKCKALNIPYAKNGRATEFKGLIPRTENNQKIDSAECYTIDSTNSEVSEKQQTYYHLIETGIRSSLDWGFTEEYSSNSINSILQLAA